MYGCPRQARAEDRDLRARPPRLGRPPGAGSFGAGCSHLISLGLDDNLCVYDANSNYQPMKFIPIRGPLVASASPACACEN